MSYVRTELVLFLLFLLLLLMVLVSACGAAQGESAAETDCGGHFHMAPDLTREEREDVLAAVVTWQEFSKRDVTVDGVPSASCTFRSHLSDSGHHAGLYADGTHDVWIERRDEPWPWRRTVLLHEIGHSFGMKHVEADMAIMTASCSSMHLTEIDRAECRRVGWCAGP